MLLIGSFGLLEWALYHGTSEEQARTIAINVFVVGESFFYLIAVHCAYPCLA